MITPLAALTLFAVVPIQLDGSGSKRQLSPFESGEVVALEIPSAPGTQHEYFRLRDGEQDVGVVAVHVGSEGTSMRTEMHQSFFSIKTRVIHIEHQTPSGPRLIWREIRLQSGRTVLVEWGAGGDLLTSVDWSGRDAVRREQSPESGALLPMFLVDRVRRGQFLSGRFDVFDPISNRVEEWSVSVARTSIFPRSTRSARRLLLTREDGSLAGEYLFLGENLIAFRLQSGGAVAQCIDRAAYDQMLEQERQRRRREVIRDRPSPASTSGL